MFRHNSSLTLLRIDRYVIALIFVLCFVPSVRAQTDSISDVKEAQKKYQEATGKLRTAIAEANRTHALYFHSRAAEADRWRDQWQQAGQAGNEAAQELKNAAIEILMKSNEPGEEVMAVAVRACRELREQAHFDQAYEIATRLVELDDKMEFQLEQAKAALISNHFDVAAGFFKSHPERLAGLSKSESKIFGQLSYLQQAFNRELEIRQQEADADDLPRVEFETTKGNFVIELFENEAPQTVGNFVSLVEIGYYDGILFHQVERGFLAQAGGYTKQGPTPVGYSIYDEFREEDARKHFRGSVSMASRPPEPNSGSSQFFVLAVPAAELDNYHTVFGRVISGMDVIDALEPNLERDEEGQPKPIEGAQYDQINKARVLRKRDHEYKPIRVTE